MLLAIALAFSLQFLLFALFSKAQPKEVANEAKREHGHSIHENVSQQRLNKVCHSPVPSFIRQTAAPWQAQFFSLRRDKP
jgi:hypothetical protein